MPQHTRLLAPDSPSVNGDYMEAVASEGLSIFATLRRAFAYAPWLQNLLMGRSPVASSTFMREGSWQSVVAAIKVYRQHASAVDIPWQLALFSALVYDIQHHVRYPSDRYGNTTANIFFGFAPNPDTFSTHWGSDRVPDGIYWIAPSVLLGLTALLGIGAHYRLKALVSRQYQGPEDLNTSYHTVPELSENTLVLQSSSCERAAEQLEKIFSRLQATLSSSSLILRHSAIERITALSDSHSVEDNPAAPTNDKRQWRTQARVQLEAMAQPTQRYLTRLHAQYRGWGLGEETSVAPQIAFYLFVLWQYFANYHYWRLLVVKLMVEPIRYADITAACLAVNKIYAYSAQRGQDYCGICNWAFVPYQLTNDPQACLDYLFQQDFSPAVFVDYLQRFQHHTNFSRVSLHHTAWSETWDEAEWDDVLWALESVISSPLKIFDLSSAYPTEPRWDKKLERLVGFNQRVRPGVFNFTHQGYGRGQLAELFPGFINGHTHTLDLYGTGLSDEEAEILADHLPEMALTDLMIANNNLSDYGLEPIAEALPLTQIENMVLSGNRMGDRGVFAIIEAAKNSSTFNALDLSDMPLSYAVVTTLLQAIADTPLTRITLRNCRLDDLSLEHAGPAIQDSLEHLDISANAATDYWLFVMRPYLYGALIQSIDLSHTDITAQGLNLIGSAIPHAALRVIDCSGCFLSGDLDEFFAGVAHPQASVEVLKLMDTGISQQGMASFVNAITFCPDSALTAVYFNDNQLPTAEGVALVKATANTHIDTLGLSGNAFGDEIIETVAQHLSQWPLSFLDIGHANIFASIPVIAEQCIAPMENFRRLGERYLSTAQKRDLHTKQRRNELVTLHVPANDMNTDDAILGCRVFGQVGTQFNAENNPVDTSIVNLTTCQISSASRSQLGAAFNGPLALLAVTAAIAREMPIHRLLLLLCTVMLLSPCATVRAKPFSENRQTNFWQMPEQNALHTREADQEMSVRLAAQ